ncbi:MAG: hypothetical protein K2H07_01440, partial [Lachnospiraceae bacterium]|nr:hypothetical protein [Lachnospiraceae bacterium]
MNTVELKGGKDPEYNRTESATVPKANLLQKQGLGYDPISQIATWRITVNESGRPLKQVKVEDVFPGDFFDKDTVSVSISPSVGSVGNVTAASENPYGYSDPQGITINLGDIEDTVYITVSMKIKPKDKEDWYTFKNAAILTSPTIATKRVPAEFNAAIEKVKLASKSGKKTDNKEGYITWTIEVKGQKQRPEGYTIKDYLPENMEFVQGSFRVQNQWYDGNPSYKPQVTVISTGQDGQPIAKPYIEYTFTAEDARFLDTVGNGGAFWIQYETRVKDVNDAQKSTTYTNNADVTAKFPNNVVVSEKENASVTETLGGILGKEYAYKQGTNEVTWIVKINEAKTDMSAIKNPTIKDQLEDYLEYKAGSGKLYLVSTNGTRTEVPDTNYQVVVVNNLVTVVLPNISTNYYEFEFTTRFTKGAGDMSQIKVNNKVDLVGDGVVAH